MVFRKIELFLYPRQGREGTRVREGGGGGGEIDSCFALARAIFCQAQYFLLCLHSAKLKTSTSARLSDLEHHSDINTDIRHKRCPLKPQIFPPTSSAARWVGDSPPFLAVATDDGITMPFSRVLTWCRYGSQYVVVRWSGRAFLKTLSAFLIITKC